jgi:uncharacterized repeat protein (TIGR03809 family)
MTNRLDVARGREVAARWCNLAERRLEYLTELFETGRWRRYHSELALLENIQEAKTAVEIWRDLSVREASRDNSAIDMSWLGRSRSTPPRSEGPRVRIDRPQPQPVAIPAEPSAPVVPIALAANHVSSAEAPSAPRMENAPEPTPATIAERYPLLRNAL